MQCLFVFVGLVALGASTQVNQCPGENIANLEKHVIITGCDDPPCHAKRKSQLPIKFKFTAANIPELNDKVSIGACDKPPCKLKKNTKVPLTLKFQPEHPFTSLSQVVNANVLGVPLPFVGVDGTDACSKIYEEDGTTKAGCNFEKGKTYVFKDNIDVLQIYPRIKTVVHWSLTDPSSGKDAICFEVPARITP